MTRQSVQSGTDTGIGLLGALAMFTIDVLPAAAQTFLPPRSSMPFAADALGTSTVCPAW